MALRSLKETHWDFAPASSRAQQPWLITHMISVWALRSIASRGSLGGIGLRMGTCIPDQEQPSEKSTTSSFDADALTKLFPEVAAITIVLLVVLIAIRGKTGAKAWDQVAFVASVTAAVLLAVHFLRKPQSTVTSRLAVITSVVGILFGMARVQHFVFGTIFWNGFGTSVALLSLPIALVIVPVSGRVRQSRRLACALAILMCSLALIDAASLIRDLGDFTSTYNNRFVLNEVLAPAAGRIPGADFVPAYTTLEGWFIFPFRHVFSANELANLSTILLSCFGICAVTLAVILARRTLPKRSLWLAVGLTVPLASVTVLHGNLESSIASNLQELPIRVFPSMLYSLMGVGALVTLLQHSVPKVSLVLLGVLAGLMAWNSQDFGIAVAVAYGLVLQIATRRALRKQVTIIWLTGALLGVLSYPILALAIGHPIQFKYLFVAVRSFGGGFAAVPIQIPGPVLLVLPVILGSAAVGGCLLWRASGDTSARPRYQQFAVATLAFVGLWSTLALPYYVNESYATGQLQTFLLPYGVCCCALLSLCHAAAIMSERRLGASVRVYLRGGGLWLMSVTLPIAVGFGSILQTPYPSVAFNALAHPPASIGFLETVSSGDVSLAESYVRTHGGGTVGYFGPNANFLKLLTGVQARILFDDPANLGLSKAAHSLGCQFIRHRPTPWLVVSPGSFPFVGPTICGDYRPWPVPGEPPNTVFKLRDRLVGQ